jgi:integrase
VQLDVSLLELESKEGSSLKLLPKKGKATRTVYITKATKAAILAYIGERRIGYLFT